MFKGGEGGAVFAEPRPTDGGVCRQRDRLPMCELRQCGAGWPDEAGKIAVR